MTNTIGQTSSVLPNSENVSTRKANDILGKDDFLKILITQLQNQDPLNPMEDKDFIAQMATFSSLEQLTNMNKNLETWIQSSIQANMLAYNELIGKDVVWHKVEGEDVIEGKGTVKTIKYVGDTVQIILADGTELSPANISETTMTGGENNEA